MCMFYGKPTRRERTICKPITAYKVINKEGRYLYAPGKPKRGVWLTAKPTWPRESVTDAGFHCFKDLKDAHAYLSHEWGIVVAVKIKGTVYGKHKPSTDRYPSGLRVSHIKFYRKLQHVPFPPKPQPKPRKPKTKPKSKSPKVIGMTPAQFRRWLNA